MPILLWRFGYTAEEWKTNLMWLAIFFTSYVLNMFRPHQISNTQRTENKTKDVVIKQHSRKLPMMDILMSETCWLHKKWNKIASDIKSVFHSSAITMMHNARSNKHKIWLHVSTLQGHHQAFIMKHFIKMFTNIYEYEVGSCLDTNLLRICKHWLGSQECTQLFNKRVHNEDLMMTLQGGNM